MTLLLQQNHTTQYLTVFHTINIPLTPFVAEGGIISNSLDNPLRLNVTLLLKSGTVIINENDATQNKSYD